MGNTSVDISGFGLAGKEVTLAEILSGVGYNTVHIGKWHMGDIKEAWPNYQGFDFAAFPIHQQGQLTIFNDDAANEERDYAIIVANYRGTDHTEFKVTADAWSLAPFPGDAPAIAPVYRNVVGTAKQAPNGVSHGREASSRPDWQDLTGDPLGRSR